MEKLKMKSTAKFLTGLTLAVVLVVGYYIISSRLFLNVQTSAVPAIQRQAEFEQIVEDVNAGRYEGVLSIGDINAYSFLTIEIEAKNFSPFTAEWIQFATKRLDGDVLISMQDAGPKDIPSFKTDNFTVTVLTENPETIRGGWLEYYIFGRFHSIDALP